MGLGVLYRADRPQRDLEQLWQEVAAVVERLTSKLGSPISDWFWSHAQEDRLWLSVVPFEENVELYLEQGQVVLSAKTSGAGPGYHEFVVAILDALETELGLGWTTADEGEGDETGFRELRDPNALRREMVAGMRALVTIVLERVGRGALINMGVDWRPSVQGFAASPLGEWSKEWFERVLAANDEDVLAGAEDFYPWWNTSLTGDEFAKFGMILCWNDVRWVPPMTDAEAEAIRLALDCFDRGRAQGTRLGLPVLEQRELERLMHPEALEQPPAPLGIGYRRRTVTATLPGAWELEVPGYFHETVEDEGGTQVYWFGERTLRASTLSFESDQPATERLEALLDEDAERLVDLPDEMAGAVETTIDTDNNGWVTHVTLVTQRALCSLTFAYSAERDREWALQLARTVRSRN